MKNIVFSETDADVTINPNMVVHPNPAPRKMAIATAILEKYNVAQKNKRKQKLTILQQELLNFYSIEPSEVQMQQLKDFLHQLFIDDIYKVKALNK